MKSNACQKGVHASSNELIDFELLNHVLLHYRMCPFVFVVKHQGTDYCLLFVLRTMAAPPVDNISPDGTLAQRETNMKARLNTLDQTEKAPRLLLRRLRASKAHRSTKKAGERFRYTASLMPVSRCEHLENPTSIAKRIVLQFERSALDEDADMQSGIFTCHIDFHKFQSTQKQVVKQIKVLKQITSDEPWINSDWDSGAETPEGEMSREEKRMLLD